MNTAYDIKELERRMRKFSKGYQTENGSLLAHFEHTIAVTKNGCRGLTSLE